MKQCSTRTPVAHIGGTWLDACSAQLRLWWQRPPWQQQQQPSQPSHWTAYRIMARLLTFLASRLMRPVDAVCARGHTYNATHGRMRSP